MTFPDPFWSFINRKNPIQSTNTVVTSPDVKITREKHNMSLYDLCGVVQVSVGCWHLLEQTTWKTIYKYSIIISLSIMLNDQWSVQQCFNCYSPKKWIGAKFYDTCFCIEKIIWKAYKNTWNCLELALYPYGHFGETPSLLHIIRVVCHAVVSLF